MMIVLLLLLSIVMALQLAGLIVPAWLCIVYLALMLLSACGAFSLEAQEFARGVLEFTGAMIFLAFLAVLLLMPAA
jgi:hypothetical protein